MSGKIEEKEAEILNEFSFFPDWTEKYQYIIELGNRMNQLSADKRTDEYKITGCQSNVWLSAEIIDGRIIFTADSDSSIVKGLIAVLIRVLSGQTPHEIINAKLEFIDKLGLKRHLAQTRANGLSAMIKQIKLYALGYQIKQKNSN
jgi:cysteine desulfuration protein SufE